MEKLNSQPTAAELFSRIPPDYTVCMSKYLQDVPFSEAFHVEKKKIIDFVVDRSAKEVVFLCRADVTEQDIAGEWEES